MLSFSSHNQLQFNASTTPPITPSHDVEDPFALAFQPIAREQEQFEGFGEQRLSESTDEHVFGFFGVDLSPPPCDFGLEPLPEISFPQPPAQENVTRSSPRHRAVKASPKPPSPPPPLEWEAPSSPEPTPDLHSANHKIANLRRTIEKMSLRIKELEMIVAQGQNTPSNPPSNPEGGRRLSVSSNASDSTSGGSIVVRKEGVTDTPPASVAASSSSPSTHSPGAEATTSDAASNSAPNSATAVLSLVGEIEEQWYADRPYPPIKLRVVHKDTRAPIVPNSTVKVEAFLMDGYGQRCDKLGGPAAAHDFVFESEEDGTVVVSNIRFTHVSSKSGGHYTLVVQPLPGGDEAIERFVSDRVTVLSYRLFNARKLDFGRLTPTDPLSKVKGIGSLYAKRFAQLGIHTVADLAKLTTDDNTGGGASSSNGSVNLEGLSLSCGQVIENLRKVRGALTRQRLDEYVVQAREVVARVQVVKEETGLSTNKRRREGPAVPNLLMDGAKAKRRCFDESARASSRQLVGSTLPNVFDLPY